MARHGRGQRPATEEWRGARTSLRRALRLLEAADRREGGATLDELARAAGVPLDTARRLVGTLEHEGYLRGLRDGGYALGGAAALLGQYDRERMVRIRLGVRLGELRDELGAAVYFSRYHDGEISVEATADAPAAPAVREWVDFRTAAHASAMGRCLLGQLDYDGRRDHLARYPAVPLTPRTVTDPDAVLHRLDRQPATVPVLDLEEYALGTVCAAVPVTAGSTVGCLAVSMPIEYAYRLRRTAELLALRAAPVMLAMAV